MLSDYFWTVSKDIVCLQSALLGFVVCELFVCVCVCVCVYDRDSLRLRQSRSSSSMRSTCPSTTKPSRVSNVALFARESEKWLPPYA